MTKYNVLWIEDEPEKQDSFLDEAALEGIDLHLFKTNKLGMDELETHINFYDAVILDAKGYEKSEDERASLTGLQNSINAINAFSKKIPYFIYSGYLDKVEYGIAREMLNNEEIFTKGKDNQQLLTGIKEEADKQLDTQIRHEFAPLFRALESYDPDHQTTVLEILRAVKTGGQVLNGHLYFTPLRIILEKMFRKANSTGLLHDYCVTRNGSQVNLTESSRFMAGLDTKHLKIRCTRAHFPKIVADNVYKFLEISGAASHTSEVDVTQNIDVQAYRTQINTPYLLFNLLFTLADVLVWFDIYSKDNNDITTNQGYWEEIDFDEDGNKWEVGEITRVASNGWGTVKLYNTPRNISVYKGIVQRENLLEGERVRLTIEESIKAAKIERI